MDFTLPPEAEAYRARVAAFVEAEILPLEADPANFADHDNIPEPVLARVRHGDVRRPQPRRTSPWRAAGWACRSWRWRRLMRR